MALTTASNLNYKTFPMQKSEALSLIIAFAGVLVFALFSFWFTFLPEYAPNGLDVYDQYYLAILQGRLDLKASVLRYEGHYLSDGTGYLYHGIAPLLTRFAFGWLVDLKTVSLAPFSIWLWASVGTAFYHLTLHRIIINFRPQSMGHNSWIVIISLMCWFATPGMLLASNVAFYHEPIAVAYAATSIFIYIFSKYHFFNFPINKAIIPLAIMAAVTVHARPNIAIGLYIGVILLCVVGLWKIKRQMVLSSLIAMMILGAAGFGYIGLNIAKFGSSSVSHGSFTKSEVQYGTSFWANENLENSERARAFVEHGRFNLKRVPFNFALYTFDPPFYVVGLPTSQKIGEIFASIIKPSLGFIRIEYPRTGVFYLWLAWISIIIYSLFKFSNWYSLKNGFVILMATGIPYIMTLSYATVTFRYRFDMWPFFAALVILVLPTVVKNKTHFKSNSQKLLAILLVGISIQMSLQTAYLYRLSFREAPNSVLKAWSVPFCKSLVAAKNLGIKREIELCE